MAERPDPRKLRVSGGWSGAPYAYSSTPVDESPLPLLAGPVSRYPLAEFAPHRSDRLADRPVDRDSSRPPRTADRGTSPPGLYDLPALLARIWSVPATKMAKSGSYATAPEAAAAPRPPEREFPRRPFDPRLEERDSLAEWGPSTHEHDPSLPLAAVPSLTMIPSFPPRLPDPLPSAPSSPGAVIFSPLRQYVAWRHPPCRLAYDTPLPRGIHCGRGSPADRAGAELLRAAGYARAVRRDWMMRPASSGWLLHREDGTVAIEA
jgi:hypothetical protein